MSDIDTFEFLDVRSAEDYNYDYVHDDLSSTLPDWALSSPDTSAIDIDIDSLHLSSVPSIYSLKDRIKATRNGHSEVLSNVSQFVGILARSGIYGPRLLEINLRTRAVKIGAGAQFVVFKEKSEEGFLGNEGLVIKRINVPLSPEKDQRFASGTDYRLQLKTLELEVLALCNPLLRGHRNIVSLVAWGYDYPFADTPVPVLFMEAAIMPLTDFLKAENDEILGDRPFDVKYHLGLDIANGLQALHHLHIVHGDIKPDNVLIFKGRGDKVPFCAKLSDFGVCIDMETPGNKLTMSDYRGTPGWLAPEVSNADLSRFSPFTPDLMLRFDAYSFGFVLLSIFTQHGDLPVLHGNPSDVADEVFEMLYSQDGIPSAIRLELRKAIQRLLAEDPRKRPLPSPDLLKTDTSTFASWYTNTKTTPHVGTLDPMYNKGPLFWYRLDPTVLSELEEQYLAANGGQASDIPGAVLFGMAQNVTGAKPSYLDRLLMYLTDAAKAGFSPAMAVYAQIMQAHDKEPALDDSLMDQWTLEAISEGYLFAKPSRRISQESIQGAKDKFRRNGGFCADPFLRKSEVVEVARDGQKAMGWHLENGKIVDHKGNTMLHAAAALGALDSVRALVESAKFPVNFENDNHETPLYKACQAGHTDVINYLLDQGAKASHTTKQGKVTALHWLFMVPQSSIQQVATRLVKEGGANVDAIIVPRVGENSGGFPEKIQILHFPFELPHGTPLHWACFFRNFMAINVLITLGANVNAMYDGFDQSTTPLALAAWFGEPSVARYLIAKGADGKMKDSKGRNTLHSITQFFPDRHGFLKHHWHYWIRHGNYEEHLRQMTDLVKVLVDAGADIDAKDKAYPPLAPITAAADSVAWDGGLICALLESGARLSMEDTVLHSWTKTVGPRLDYPRCYMHTFRKIASAIVDVDLREPFQKYTPLHTLATVYHPEEEFEEACQVLLSHDPPADINAKTVRGSTPLSIALGTKGDPKRRGLYLLQKGADLLSMTTEGKDMFFSIANNEAISDQESHDLIHQFLVHLKHESETVQEAYESNFLANQGSVHALFASAEKGKVKTTELLLSLGLASRVNDLNRTKSPPWTALDHALQSAEVSRRMHMDKLSTYKSGAAQKNALALNLVYDDNQGPPSRAAEAHKGFPELLRRLREQGAKRACQLDPLPDSELITTEYVQQPGFWDLTAIYKLGFTPSTQPDRDNWQPLYDLARYPAGVRQWQLDVLQELYMDGVWRPDVKMLEDEKDRGFVEDLIDLLAGVESRKNRSQRTDPVVIEAADGPHKKLEVKIQNRRIISRRKAK